MNMSGNKTWSVHKGEVENSFQRNHIIFASSFLSRITQELHLFPGLKPAMQDWNLAVQQGPTEFQLMYGPCGCTEFNLPIDFCTTTYNTDQCILAMGKSPCC